MISFLDLPSFEGSLQSDEDLHLSLVERSGILPARTTFFSEALPLDGRTPDERREQRAAWFERAQDALSGCDFVFVDPDNGLEVKSVKRGSRLAGKYAAVEEVSALLAAGAGVILYQHRDRSPGLRSVFEFAIR